MAAEAAAVAAEAAAVAAEAAEAEAEFPRTLKLSGSKARDNLFLLERFGFDLVDILVFPVLCFRNYRALRHLPTPNKCMSVAVAEVVAAVVAAEVEAAEPCNFPFEYLSLYSQVDNLAQALDRKHTFWF